MKTAHPRLLCALAIAGAIGCGSAGATSNRLVEAVREAPNAGATTDRADIVDEFRGVRAEVERAGAAPHDVAKQHHALDAMSSGSKIRAISSAPRSWPS